MMARDEVRKKSAVDDTTTWSDDEVARLLSAPHPASVPRRRKDEDEASAKKRSMSVAVGAKSTPTRATTRLTASARKSPLLRSLSLQQETNVCVVDTEENVVNVVNRPAIPTGNMLTESLMNAAEERRRKKSVSASIRRLATPPSHTRLIIGVLVALVVVLVISLVAVVLLLVPNDNLCYAANDKNDSFADAYTSI